MTDLKNLTTTKHKLTAAQVEGDCPARLQQIGKEIKERLAKADKQTEVAQNHLIAIEKLLIEAKELCDGGGFNKFRELFCPQLGKSQAYALLAVAAQKKTLAEHRTEERERKQRTRAKQKAAAANSGTVPETAAPEAEPEAEVEPEPVEFTKLDYSGLMKEYKGLMKEYKKLERAYQKLEGKQPLRKGDDEEWVTVNDWRELSKRERKQEAVINELSAALNAKEAQESRNWPADMTPKQLKLRDKCLSAIAWFQRDLEQLYGEVTGQSSWRVVVTTKDGKRFGTGARFGTRGEAEINNANFAPGDRGGVGEDYASGEVIPCAEEKANVRIDGNRLSFDHGGCVLLNWRPVGDDDPTDDDAPTSGEKRKAVNAEEFAALDAGSEA